MNTVLTYANIDDVLTRCFLKFWNDRTPVVFKNQTPTMFGNDVPAWVYFTVYKNASRQDSFGSDGPRRFVRIGRIYVEIFVQTGFITGLQTELAAAVVDYYERKTWSPLRIGQISQSDLPDGAHRRASIAGDGAWFGTQVNIQWAFDDIK